MYSLLLILVFSTSWFHYDIDIFGKTIFDLSGMFTIILVGISIYKIKYLIYDSKNLPLIIYLLALGLIYLLISIYIKGLPSADSIGTFRRLFVYPVIGIICGQLLFYRYKNSIFLIKAINIYLYLVPIFLIVDLFIFNFHYDSYSLARYIPRTNAFIFFFLILAIHYLDLKNSFRANRLKYLIISIFILLTISRGVILTIVLFSLFYILINSRGLIDLTKYLFYYAIAGILVALVIINIPNARDSTYKKIEQIYNFSKGYEGTSGRNISSLDLRAYRYVSAFNSGLKNPIFGNGIGFKEDFYIGGNYNRYEEHKTAHNILLTLWYKMGIVGLVLYVAFLLFIYKKINFMPAKLLFSSAYFYSLFDVMMASTTSAIFSIYIIVGYYLNDK